MPKAEISPHTQRLGGENLVAAPAAAADAGTASARPKWFHPVVCGVILGVVLRRAVVSSPVTSLSLQEAP